MDPYYRKVLMFISSQRTWNFSHRHAVVKVEDSEEEVTLIDRLEEKKETLIFTTYCQNMEC
jgi:hypothetical protein